jgi:hypothetical protein
MAGLSLPFIRLHINHEKEQCPAQTHGAQPQVPSHVRSSRQVVPRDCTRPSRGSPPERRIIPALNNRRTLSKRCAFLFGSFCLQSVQVLRHSHRPCCLGNAGVLIHCDDCDPMSSRRQRESFEQLIVQYLCSLGAVNPQLQPLDSER